MSEEASDHRSTTSRRRRCTSARCKLLLTVPRFISSVVAISSTWSREASSRSSVESSLKAIRVNLFLSQPRFCQ